MLDKFFKGPIKRPFSLFLERALYASEHLSVEEKVKFILRVWKHKQRYYEDIKNETK